MIALVSFVLWFFFPDSPVEARFLTEEEKIIAVKRVAEAKIGVKNKKFKGYQVAQRSRAPLSTSLTTPSPGAGSLGRSQDVASVCGFDCSADSKWVGLPVDHTMSGGEWFPASVISNFSTIIIKVRELDIIPFNFN